MCSFFLEESGAPGNSLSARYLNVYKFCKKKKKKKKKKK